MITDSGCRPIPRAGLGLSGQMARSDEDFSSAKFGAVAPRSRGSVRSTLTGVAAFESGALVP